MLSGKIPTSWWGGITISGIVGDKGSPPALVTGSATTQVYCGTPPAGDDRDSLIADYANGLIPLPLNVVTPAPPFAGTNFKYPHCDQLTASFQNLNVGSPSCIPDHTYLLVKKDFPPAFSAWLLSLDGGTRSVNSAYRSPKVNACAKGVSGSRHMFGDAVDLPSIGKTTASSCKSSTPLAAMDPVCLDIHRMHKRALAAGFNWLETWQPTWYGCQPGHATYQDCVHADLRYSTASYVSP
jgi:hypothetical protein